jgi:hypothetical protein
MAGASEDGEINVWPAFVDVLTTVIMVVTFLLVIMSAAVMMLSQRVVAQLQKQFEAREQQMLAAAPTKAAAKQVIASKLPPGRTALEVGDVLRSEAPVMAQERLTIRTRDTKDTLQIAVKALEQPAPATGSAVTTAATLLKIAFEAKAVSYAPDDANKVLAFLRDHQDAGAKYEIWSFAPQTVSVSEAQRLAYYRAATTRNLLIRAGITPENITTQIRVNDPVSPNEHLVRVVLKP